MFNIQILLLVYCVLCMDVLVFVEQKARFCYDMKYTLGWF